MRAIIYLRVSSKEQVKNLSLPTQRKRCLEYCEREGIEPDQIFVEEGESAKTADRPVLQRMLGYARTKKGQLQHLIVYSVNRFARNSHDHAAMASYLNGLGITLRSATEPLGDTPIEKFMETCLSGVAQLDNDIRGDRAVEGMRAAIERGRWVWGPPLGYTKTSAKAGAGPSLEAEPEAATLLLRAFQLVGEDGLNQIDAQQEATRLGLRSRSGKPLVKQTFTKILRNPAYKGWIRTTLRGVRLEVRGDWEPIVPEALFDRVQAILEAKRPQASSKSRDNPDFPLRGFVLCSACGRPLTGGFSKGRRGGRFPYYRCQSGCFNIAKREIEGDFLKLMERLRPKPQTVQLFREVVLDLWQQRQAEATSARKRQERRLSKLKAKKEQLIEAYIYEKKIDDATYEDQLDKLNQAITLAEMETHDTRLDELDVEGVLGFAEHVVLNAGRRWTEAALEGRQRLQGVLFPDGVSYLKGEGYRTPEVCPLFKDLRQLRLVKSTVAGPFGLKPR